MIARRKSSTPASPTVTGPEVLKAGGRVFQDADSLRRLGDYVAQRLSAGRLVVVVHGGGVLISSLHEQLGLETVKHGGLRVTPAESMTAVTMALRGAANAQIVSHLVSRDVPALGISGVDLGVLRSRFLNRDKLGRVGGPPTVDAGRLEALLAQGYVPVIAPVCLGPDGGLLNVNADSVAHAVAVAIKASSLDFVSDVPGVFERDGQVRPRIRGGEMSSFLEAAEIKGGMIPKLQASLAAVIAGVGRVRIGTLDSLAANQATEVTL